LIFRNKFPISKIINLFKKTYVHLLQCGSFKFNK